MRRPSEAPRCGTTPHERAAAAPRPGACWCSASGATSLDLRRTPERRDSEFPQGRPPWCGFEPNFMLFEKCEGDGARSHPLFAFLREAVPAPSDDATALLTDPKLITGSPVCRNDVAWNFEKFLVGPDGVPCTGTAVASRPLTSSLTSKPCCPKGPAVPRAPLLPRLPVSCSAALGRVFIYKGVSSKPTRRNT
ncbi:Glutathione peroxidase 1 [Plecturocebus cupreus]